MPLFDLQPFGLSEGESEIYVALLTFGSQNAMQLAKRTGRHRTHIYDTLEKLKEKGLVSESIIDNKRAFVPADPQNLLDHLKEKQEKAEAIVPQLRELAKISATTVKVETYKGKSGLITVLRDILKEKKDYVGFGEGTRFDKVLLVFFSQFRLESRRLGIHLKLILKQGAKIAQREGLTVRYLDVVSPSTTFVYGDKVAVIIWEPEPTAIRITDKQTAESYRNYFTLLWEMAES